MFVSRTRTIGISIIAISVAAIAVGMTEMTLRLKERSETTPSQRWHIKRINDQKFEFAGDPVEIRTIEGDEARVELHWRDKQASIPVTGRDDPRLKELTRHHEWLRVLIMVQVTGGETANEALEAGRGDPRLVLVGRAHAPGYDSETWGKIHRKKWVYNFISATPDGRVERSESTFKELEKRTWQFTAAMITTDVNKRKKATFVDDGFEDLGWSWAVARSGVLGLVIGLMVFGASFVRSPREPEPSLA